MKQQKILFYLIGLALFSFLLLKGFENSSDNKQSIFDLLKEEGFSKVTLVTDMEQLLQNKSNETYQAAEMRFQKADETFAGYSIQLKTRGETRKELCDFPPLKLKFSEKDLKKQGLADYTSLKLVTHCREDADFEQTLLREYLTYKMYNCLTDKSFRVKLVQIQYVDSKSKLPPVEQYGFVLENKKEMANRLQARLIDEQIQPLKKIDYQQYQLFTVFQYMVGNTDWNLSKQHNIKLLQIKDSPSPIPVPYDFDFAGLVNSPFAKPYPSLPIADVKERFFQYRGKSNADFREICDIFKAKKSEILELCVKLDFLELTAQADMINYLESFYKLINIPEKTGKELFEIS